MLSRLTIQNYALIRSLDIRFDTGLSIITGETGAGKSILLGALGLITGDRADSSVALDKTKKCVVEGYFMLAGYSLESFFTENDLDYAEETLIRREITQEGRSRAFINDTPVNLAVLKSIGDRLIDIHSQHNTQYLHLPAFQLRMVDSFAGMDNEITLFSEKFRHYKTLNERLSSLTERYKEQEKETEYFNHLFAELEQAGIKAGEQEELEEELKQLSHIEDIQRSTSYAVNTLSEGNVNITGMLRDTVHELGKAKNWHNSIDELINRLNSSLIELRDIDRDIQNLLGSLTVNPARIEQISSRLDSLYSFMHKHKAESVESLLKAKEELELRLNDFNLLGEEIAGMEKESESLRKELETLSENMHIRRKNVLPTIEGYVIESLHKLGMPNAVFKIDLKYGDNLTVTGRDNITFLFSAHSDLSPQAISKIASGGEMSRIMLSIKAVVSENIMLPTLIFDEIDTGVSGEIASKMGGILVSMAKNAQIINITHLPQVAAKGNSHYHVYKKEDPVNGTSTCITKLSKEERVNEIARMLSGETITNAAMENARYLLGLQD